MSGRLERLADRANPVCIREIRRSLRGRLPISIFLVVQATLFVLCYGWLEGTAAHELEGGEGEPILMLIGGVFAVCAWILLPLYAYAWIFGEKRDGTFELLGLTPLGEGRAALGRLQAGMVQLLFLLSAMAPFVCFAYLLGGVDVLTIGIALVGIFVVAAVYFLAGVAWSHLPEAGPSFFAMGAVLAVLIAFPGSLTATFIGLLAAGPLDRLGVAAGIAIVVAVLGAIRWLIRRRARGAAESDKERPRRPILIEGLWAVEVEALKKEHVTGSIRVRALDRVTFTFRPGEITGLVGANGAGKTTMLRILATIDRPDWGNAWFGADSLAAAPDRLRKRIGFVPDRAGFYTNQTVEEYLDFFARACGLSGDRRRRTLADVVAFAGLDPLRDRPCTGLSKGQAQRVHFARALLHDPDVFLLDEPMEGLDPRARIEFRELLRALAGQGKAVLLSSHILTEMDEFIDRLVVLDQGRVVLQGELETLRRRVGLSAIVRLRVRADQEPARLERWLLEHPRDRIVRTDGRDVLVELADANEGGDRLVHDLFEAGVRLESMKPETPGLEGLFLGATQGTAEA